MKNTVEKLKMCKKTITCAIALFICFGNYAKADDFVAIGVHSGLHHNVGKLDSYDPSIQVDTQNNYFLGFSFKTNLAFLFARFGFDTTFLINRGKTLENSNEIASTKIHYLSMPFFFGSNYKVLDIGNFYMGPGFSFFMARGRITVNSPGLSDDIDASAWGYGFIAGIEYKLSISIDFYFEWEYLNARSESVIQTQTTRNWKNFYIDFTGNRIIFGIRYYLI